VQDGLRAVESGERRGGSDSTVVVIGDGDLSKETASALEALGADVTHLEEPEQDEVREARGARTSTPSP
jgi:phosphoglycerate dehydrogenase-like enzyme